MLLVVRRGREIDVQRHFSRWGLHSDIVGRITDDGLIRVLEAGHPVAELPIRLLTEEVPTYVREARPAAPTVAGALAFCRSPSATSGRATARNPHSPL